MASTEELEQKAGGQKIRGGLEDGRPLVAVGMALVRIDAKIALPLTVCVARPEIWRRPSRERKQSTIRSKCNRETCGETQSHGRVGEVSR